jgi:hypothetical protein
MKRLNGLVAALFASIASLLLASAIAVAQPASQGAAGGPPTEMGGAQGSMMGGGMMGGMGGMPMGGGGMGGMGGMGMGCMGGMGMMQMMQKDPKLMGRMTELQGEMMRLMSDAMIQHGKELQKGK